jgi:cryptochrome
MFKISELGYDSKPSHFAKGGEREALKILKALCANKTYVCSFNKTKTRSSTGYIKGKLSTTGLSPYLMCGAISVRTVHHSIHCALNGRAHTNPPESLLGQLYFREMFYLLSASTANYDKTSNPHCLQVDWAKNSGFVKAWTDGKTGYPYIDAIMRQLKETGWIHHLARHAVACFLTRGDLWQSWTVGRDVFHKLLIDADGALNNGNWMALSGVAPWSAPWFRIYSPIPDKSSSLNVDQDGDFVKRFVPELKGMPAKYIFAPWTAPKEVQDKAQCIIGKDYPPPIVDHAKARNANLAKFGAAVAKKSKLKKEAATGTKRKASTLTSSNKPKRSRI